MSTDMVLLDEKDIKNKMYYIRGEYVMLDSDLAKIYGYTTKRFNEQVKNNIEKFDEDFMFQLTNDEVEKNLRSIFSTSSLNNNYGGRRYNPYVFTEQGIMMLSGLLKSDIAVKVNIKIILNKLIGGKI